VASSYPRSSPAHCRFAMLRPPLVNNLDVFETGRRLRDSKGSSWETPQNKLLGKALPHRIGISGAESKRYCPEVGSERSPIDFLEARFWATHQ